MKKPKEYSPSLTVFRIKENKSHRVCEVYCEGDAIIIASMFTERLNEDHEVWDNNNSRGKIAAFLAHQLPVTWKRDPNSKCKPRI